MLRWLLIPCYCSVSSALQIMIHDGTSPSATTTPSHLPVMNFSKITTKFRWPLKKFRLQKPTILPAEDQCKAQQLAVQVDHEITRQSVLAALEIQSSPSARTDS